MADIIDLVDFKPRSGCIPAVPELGDVIDFDPTAPPRLLSSSGDGDEEDGLLTDHQLAEIYMLALDVRRERWPAVRAALLLAANPSR